MFIEHHDNIPIEIPRSHEQRQVLQRDFVEALRDTVCLFTLLGLRETDYMVHCGGAVYLHQKAVLADPDRAPTDLDIVLRTIGNERLMYDLADHGTLFFRTTKVILEERLHHGCTFSNPLVEAIAHNGFPIDFMPAMKTLYPRDNYFFPGRLYSYPTSNPRLFELGRPVQIPGVGTVNVAPPAFIAFYKLSMLRETLGKQDGHDLRRLKELGLLDTASAEVGEVLDIVSQGDEILRKKLERKICQI